MNLDIGQVVTSLTKNFTQGGTVETFNGALPDLKDYFARFTGEPVFLDYDIKISENDSLVRKDMDFLEGKHIAGPHSVCIG